MTSKRNAILDLISGRPLSFNQIAQELNVDARDGETSTELVGLLDTLRETGVVDIAIDRNAPTAEGKPVGPNTYRYYRRCEAEKLEKEGVLSKSREVEIGRNIIEIAKDEGFIKSGWHIRRERRF